jgi:nucleotide-binding universal stress UspA family protein
MTELLITTNGYKGTLPAIEFGAWLADHLHMKVSLLGINEKLNPAQIDDHHPLEEVFERAVSLFNEHGVEYSLEVRNGNAEEEIARKAQSGDFITVVSPLGRARILHLLKGRSIRQLMEDVSGPILYVPQMRVPMKKILVCMGGLGYEVTAEHLTIPLAKIDTANITLLYVIPPMELDYQTTRKVQHDRENLIDSDTPQGRSLRQAVKIIEEAGLNTFIKVRQGSVVEEILDEVKNGGYDLVCMGSPYSGSSLRQIYAPNITAEVAETLSVPILTARLKRE